MRGTTARTPLLLLLAAAAVLLGLLGMHAVAAGPHAAAGVGHQAPGSVPGGGPDHVAALTWLPAVVAEAASELELPASTSSAVAAVCLAVLLGAAVVLAAGSRPRRPLGAPCQRPRSWPVRRADSGRAPPPDLLTRLCVLRT